MPAFPFETAAAEWFPTLDLTENAHEFIVRLEVPGIPKENLDVNLTGTLFTVQGRRELINEAAGETYLRRERETGSLPGLCVCRPRSWRRRSRPPMRMES